MAIRFWHSLGRDEVVLRVSPATLHGRLPPPIAAVLALRGRVARLLELPEDVRLSATSSWTRGPPSVPSPAPAPHCCGAPLPRCEALPRTCRSPPVVSQLWPASIDPSTYLRRKVEFIPPSTPVVTGTVGMPRLISSAVSMSSRRCFSLTGLAMFSAAL